MYFLISILVDLSLLFSFFRDVTKSDSRMKTFINFIYFPDIDVKGIKILDRESDDVVYHIAYSCVDKCFSCFFRTLFVSSDSIFLRIFFISLQIDLRISGREM